MGIGLMSVGWPLQGLLAGSLSLDEITGSLSGGADLYKKERLLAEQMYQLVNKDAFKRDESIGMVYPDIEAQRALQEIASPLWNASTRKELRWRIVLTSSQNVNALTCGGGVIVVLSGLLKLCNSEAELASVIAHEIGHVEHKHAIRRMMADNLLQTYGLDTEAKLAVKLGDKLHHHTAESLRLLALGVLHRSFTRLWEHQADAFIIKSFREVGYPLAQANIFFKRLIEHFPPDADPGLCLFDSHPLTQERVNRLDMIAGTYVDSTTLKGDSGAFQYLKQLPVVV